MDSVSQLPADRCRVIEHDLGQTEICGQPEKIAVLSVHALGLLLSLDVQPVGCAMVLDIHQGRDFDNPAQQIPYLGDRLTTQPVNLGRSSEPSLEKLADLKPDLIVGEAGRNADSYELLSQIAPTLLWENRTVKGQWQESLRAIATALDRAEKAEEAIQRHEALIADARADLEQVVQNYPTLLLLGANRLEEGMYAISSESYLGEVLEGVGFQLLDRLSESGNPNAPISLETLPEFNDADSIILLGYNLEIEDLALGSPEQFDNGSIGDRLEKHQVQAIKQSWQENAIAQSLTASKENRVYFATFYKWNGLNNPIGTELILEQLRQFFATT